MRKVMIGVAAWMAVMVVFAVATHGGGEPTKEVTRPAQTQPAGAGPGPALPAGPRAPGQDEPAKEDFSDATLTTPVNVAPGSADSPASLSAEDQEKIELATSGWPAVGKLPWETKGVRVEYAGVGGGRVVLNVTHTVSDAVARNRVGLFLSSNGDFVGHYRLRLLSRADLNEQTEIANAIELGFEGYLIAPHLPLKRGQTTLSLVGRQGDRIVLSALYSGTKAKAVKDVAALFATYDKATSKYLVRYRKK